MIEDVERVTVLIVEDDPDGGELLGEFLRSASYKVLVTSSVKEALDHLAAHRVDAVLTDYNFCSPQNGGDLLAIVAEQFPSVGRVVLSGAEVPSGTMAHAAIMKPADLETILKVLRAVTLQPSRP